MEVTAIWIINYAIVSISCSVNANGELMNESGKGTSEVTKRQRIVPNINDDSE